MTIQETAKELRNEYFKHSEEEKDTIKELQIKLEQAMKLIEDMNKRIIYLENHQ